MLRKAVHQVGFIYKMASVDGATRWIRN